MFFLDVLLKNAAKTNIYLAKWIANLGISFYISMLKALLGCLDNLITCWIFLNVITSIVHLHYMAGLKRPIFISI